MVPGAACVVLLRRAPARGTRHRARGTLTQGTEMARIAGVDLPRTKRVEIGLTYIFGIGRVRSNGILKDAGVSPDIRVKDLSEDDVRKISRVIEEQGGVEGDLRRDVSMNLTRVM